MKEHKAFPTAGSIEAQAKSCFSDVTGEDEEPDTSEIEAQNEQERITDLVNITKRMNYLARKKAEL